MNLKKQLVIFFFKNWRMRILSARIFSKSFGGKIKQFLNRCYREAFFKRLAHAYCSKFQNENKMFTFGFKSSLFGN